METHGEPTNPNSRRKTSFVFFDKFRYFILFLGWFSLASISSNMLALNFTLICMSPPIKNSTEMTPVVVDNYNTFEYTSYHKNMLMWSLAVGTFLATFPLSILFSRYGAKYVLLGAGFLSAATTMMVPYAARSSFNLFLFLRFIQGVSYAADFSGMGLIVSRWASLKQNALFISVLTCYSPLSSSITNAVSGIICESYGWPVVYYGHSLACVALFSLWAIFYTDHPQQSRFVSDVELEKINRNKSESHIKMDKFVPYKEIYSSPTIWVVWLNAAADLFSGMFLLMYLPSYLKYVMNYSIEETGILASLPTLSHIPLKFVFGYSSDKLKCLPERQKMMIFNSIAVIGPGIIYLLVGFVPNEHKTLIVLLFTLIHMLFSTAGGGFYKCGTLHSRQYAHIIISNIQFVKCLTLFIGPVLMAIFVQDETSKTQWRSIFIFMSIILFISNVFFIYFVDDRPASFTLIKKDDKMKAEDVELLENNNSAKAKNLAEN